MDCGWTITSMRSAGRPKSQWASITSSPLFISVAESMVILLPIVQVGCFSARAGVIGIHLFPRRVQKRTARCGQDQPADAVNVLSLQALEDGTVFAVDREQPDIVLPHLLHDQLAADNKGFLVGERDVLAGFNGAERGVQPGKSDQSADDDVHIGTCHDVQQRLARRKGPPWCHSTCSRNCSGQRRHRSRRRRGA